MFCQCQVESTNGLAHNRRIGSGAAQKGGSGGVNTRNIGNGLATATTRHHARAAPSVGNARVGRSGTDAHRGGVANNDPTSGRHIWVRIDNEFYFSFSHRLALSYGIDCFGKITPRRRGRVRQRIGRKQRSAGVVPVHTFVCPHRCRQGRNRVVCANGFVAAAHGWLHVGCGHRQPPRAVIDRQRR